MAIHSTSSSVAIHARGRPLRRRSVQILVRCTPEEKARIVAAAEAAAASSWEWRSQGVAGWIRKTLLAAAVPLMKPYTARAIKKRRAQ